MKYYVVDAFTDKLLGGNPAGVCLPDRELDAGVMQQIASENNLSETAFILPKGGNCFGLRWFTPEVEIDLCGHATLASAYILSRFVNPSLNRMEFDTLSGVLTVERQGERFEMSFPSRMPRPVELTPLMTRSLGIQALEAHMARDLLLLLETEAQVRSLKPDMTLLKQIPDAFGVIATAKGDSADFVSRFFAPGAGVAEDPVTGSSHSTLIPFWAERLGKQEMVARQLSKRGGILYCRNDGDRVRIAGTAVLYLTGEIHI